jgi:integrase
MHDLTSTDLSERQFFEVKFREYKAFLEAQGKLSPLSIRTKLRTVASFFGRTVGKLCLRRGDWNSTLETRVIQRWRLTQDDVKRMYGHANLRDKCLLLVLAQSGFSEVDVSELRIEDIKDLYDLPVNEHYVIEKPREKTGEIQATCISFEALHDIRAMLSERGNPKEGYIFVSQTKDKGIGNIETRRINQAMKTLAIKTYGAEKAKEFKTKSLRSFYNSALLRAKIQPQEVKDLLMGHQRSGARSHYGYDEETIKEAYIAAFEFLSINGIQSREDLKKLKAEVDQKTQMLTEIITKQQNKIDELEGKFEAKLAEKVKMLIDFMNKHTEEENEK